MFLCDAFMLIDFNIKEKLQMADSYHSANDSNRKISLQAWPSDFRELTPEALKQDPQNTADAGNFMHTKF